MDSLKAGLLFTVQPNVYSIPEKKIALVVLYIKIEKGSYLPQNKIQYVYCVVTFHSRI